MKQKILLCSWAIVLLAGCVTLEPPRAKITNGVIENPGMGFFGFTYHIPEGVQLDRSAERGVVEYNDLQRMAVRIHEMNNSYHPRGGESFYESFLMLSDHAAFILVTVKQDSAPRVDSFGTFNSWEELSPQWQILPFYNIRESSQIAMGTRRLHALVASGSAFEEEGWYYPKSKPGRMEFSYTACNVMGADRDRYVLMGVSLPEHQHLLDLKMQEMMQGFRF